jgi:hypothetical protein
MQAVQRMRVAVQHAGIVHELRGAAMSTFLRWVPTQL